MPALHSQLGVDIDKLSAELLESQYQHTCTLFTTALCICVFLVDHQLHWLVSIISQISEAVQAAEVPTWVGEAFPKM